MTEAPQPGAVPSWTLADRMRKAREYAGLKQTELAADIGIARSSITNYETGRKTPSRPVLLSWALRCGVPLTWLRYGTEDGTPRPPGPGVSAGQPKINNPGYRYDMSRSTILALKAA
jgi:transcriptional regulator with XRE-family HTH domain